MAEPSDPATADRSWRNAVTLIIIGVLGFALIVGFVVLPEAQRKGAGIDLWAAICRAAGIDPGTPAQPQPVSNARAVPVSQVAWGPKVLDTLAAADRERGSTLANQVCTSCHGGSGVSQGADFPTLAGQSGFAIYKQLHDYQSGARFHPQMTPVAKQLTAAQLVDVAAYFASYKAPPGALGLREPLGEAAIARLATQGDPSRGIPACDSCHVAGTGGPIETPVITGQSSDYIARQLRAYADGTRRNDVYQRMRTISGKLTPAEIDGLARYYQGVV